MQAVVLLDRVQKARVGCRHGGFQVAHAGAAAHLLIANLSRNVLHVCENGWCPPRGSHQKMQRTQLPGSPRPTFFF